MGNWFTSAHPNSIFVNGLMGARAEPGRRYALSNNQLAVHTLNGGTEKRTLNARELRDALTDLFKLRLDQLEGLDPVLAQARGGQRMSRAAAKRRPAPARRRTAAGRPARARPRP